MKGAICLLFLPLALAGCGEPGPPPQDPNAKARVVEEQPIFESQDARDKQIDDDPSIPQEVKDALKAGAGKLNSPGTTGAPSSGMPNTGP